MSTLKHLIQFPVGDWSDDGHGKCAYYKFWCNRTVQELREVHFRCGKATGVEIGDIMNEYDEPMNPDVQARLSELGMMKDDAETRYEIDPDQIIRIWLQLLKLTDPGFEWEPLAQEPYETINFYGYDEQNRHLEVPGYGCFYS